MQSVEIWEILVSLSGDEISLSDSHTKLVNIMSGDISNKVCCQIKQKCSNCGVRNAYVLDLCISCSHGWIKK